ncbi:MAG: TRAP transporter small permease subunit [Desulfovibrionaceae bacterium]
MTHCDQALCHVPPSATAIINGIDTLNITVGKGAAWLIMPMMLSLIYEVAMRYLFHSPTIWAMDIALILYGIHFMVGSPYCLQQGQHIRTDFFYNRWSTKTRALVDMFNYIVFFFPTHLIFFDIGVNYFLKSYQQNETSVSSPWMPIIWPLKMAIPVCVGLTLLQGVSEFIKSYYRWKTGANLWLAEDELPQVEQPTDIAK